MTVSIFNDSPSHQPFFDAIHKDSLLDRLKALDSRATRKGLGSLDSRRNQLIRIGMELDESGSVTKNSYGVFNLSWQAQNHPEWPLQVDEELKRIRAGILSKHGKRLRFVIWAGMGGSAEDKNLYNSAGLLKKNIRCYVLDSTDPASSNRYSPTWSGGRKLGCLNY